MLLDNTGSREVTFHSAGLTSRHMRVWLTTCMLNADLRQARLASDLPMRSYCVCRDMCLYMLIRSSTEFLWSWQLCIMDDDAHFQSSAATSTWHIEDTSGICNAKIC